MVPLERIQAMLNGAPFDRPPYGLVTSLLGARLCAGAGGIQTQSYFTSPQWFLCGQEKIVDMLDPDILFAPFVFSYYAAAFGAEIFYGGADTPSVRKPPFDSIEALLKAPLPNAETDPHLAYLTEATRLLAERFGDARLIVVPVITPVDLPVLLLGMENWLDALLFKKDLSQALASRLTHFFVTFITSIKNAGAGMAACPVMFANPEILDRNSIQRLILPLLGSAFEASPLPVVFHHGGNRLAPNLDMYAALPNIAGYVIDYRDTFEDARRNAGKNAVLMGNISGPHFDAMTDETIKAKLSGLTADRRNDNKWIFINSGAELPYRTHESVLRQVRDFFGENFR